MKQNNPSYLFGMYEPDTDSVIVNAINDTYTNSPLTISCEKCNSTIFLDTPDDIAYLYRLAQESPLLYAELACKPNGLQEYVNAMNWFNPRFRINAIFFQLIVIICHNTTCICILFTIFTYISIST